MMEKYKFYVGKGLGAEDGRITAADEFVMSCVLFYPVCEGGGIRLKDAAYEYTYAFYSHRRPQEYIYTYAYQPEQNWSEYCRGLSGLDSGFTDRAVRFAKDGYVRISIRRKDGGELLEEDAEKASGIFEIQPLEVENVGIKNIGIKNKEFITGFCGRPDVRREIRETVKTIREKRTEGTYVFTLLTDTHYVVNGIWEDTLSALQAVWREEKPDAVIHLGDLADGMLDKESCRYYAHKVLDGLKESGAPFYLTVGNHDTNYFGGNPQALSEEEIYDYYLEDIQAAGNRKNQLWYYEDFTEGKLRCLFLHSFDYREKLRYGFPEAEIAWVEETLAELPQDWKVLVFSHDAPLARLDYWAKEIRNGGRLLQSIEKWHMQQGERVMAFVHGHTHADYIYREACFPIVSVGCSKCEYFTDKKPEGAVTARREPDTVSQELWDTMLVNPKEGRLELVRFGAGEDRVVLPGGRLPLETETDNSAFDREKISGRSVKIWAHRGASGYAPENTLEAFRMAAEMGADGVELDVQFTKDRQLVVIHDETINRVSNGQGKVADYTLEQLRKFCCNRTHPEYKEAVIPTLAEVLDLLKPTDMTINIELKTGVTFYEGIEDRVLRLVEEKGMENRVIYSSFNHASVMRIKKIKPEAEAGFLYADGTLDMPEYAKKHGIEALHPSLYNMQYPELIKECRENGVRLHVWTVNAKADMKRMADAGVDAIITNYPDVAYEVIHGEKAPQREQTEMAAKKHDGNKNMILHAAGLTYAKVRRVFVKIDAAVQKAAGK